MSDSSDSQLNGLSETDPEFFQDRKNPGSNETRKRKREVGAILVLGVLFLVLTWFEFCIHL